MLLSVGEVSVCDFVKMEKVRVSLMLPVSVGEVSVCDFVKMEKMRVCCCCQWVK